MDTQSILSNIVVASIIGGLAMTIGRRGRRAALAHILWIAFFVKLVTPPIWQVEIAIAHSQRFGWKFEWPSALWTLLSLLWFVGFLLLVLRGLVMYVRFALLVKREGRLDPEATAYVSSLLGNKRSTPPVVRLPVRLSPMLFGSLLRPKIVCPDQLWGLLTDDQRRAFLAHETAHYYRRDHWVRWLEWIVTAVYWWFPGVYFGRGQLERHEEACCDAWAVDRLGTTPRAYAETLLSVVDFVSEHDARLPRLANGMQPTYTLEERLRLLMRPQKSSQPSNALAFSALSACCGLWLLHPMVVFKPLGEVALLASLQPDHSEKQGVSYPKSKLNPELPFEWPSDHQLPEVPKGFWNARANAKWADFTLQLGNASVKAEAGKGITITPSNGKSLHFTTDDLMAMAEIPATGRVVIADASGRLRLWDLEAGTPVSLIGQHNAAITSLTYHPGIGLVSADCIGQVVRWDLDSGQMLAASSVNARVQTIRASEDGLQLAAMTGNWHDCQKDGSIYILDGKSLDHRMVVVPPHATATLVSFQDAKQWFTVDWRGQLRPLNEPDVVIGLIEKTLVSSLVFTQQALSLNQIAPPPPKSVTEPTELIYVE